MKTKEVTQPGLKYKIKLILANLTELQRVNIQKKIKQKTGISASSYFRYVNTRIGEPTDIPGEVLFAFSEVLHVSVDDLKNF